MYVVFRPPIAPAALDNLEKGISAGNPTLLHDMMDT